MIMWDRAPSPAALPEADPTRASEGLEGDAAGVTTGLGGAEGAGATATPSDGAKDLETFSHRPPGRL